MKKSLIIGAVFGVIAPFLGLFVGLQVSPVLGNLLLFPIVAISPMLDQPFGMASLPIKLLCLLLSMLFWSGVFFAVSKAIQLTKKSSL